MVLQFLSDEEAGKSYIIGNNGAEEVAELKNAGGVTFVEVTGTGNVSVTTITHDLKSVHSRNTILALTKNELIPSQHYGTCTLQ